MRKIKSQLTIFCHQMKLLVLGLSYIQLTCWPKWLFGNPRTTKDNRLLSLQTN